MVKRVAIIGLGWVGEPLAHSLASKAYSVIGTRRTAEKIAQYSQADIRLYQLQLPADKNALTLLPINHFDTIVIAIPPGFKQGATDYAENVAAIVGYAQHCHVKQVILLSSSGVYTGLSGRVDEQTPLDFSHTKVQQLYAAEQSALNFVGDSQVLRLAGLIGPKRNPGSFLAGKTDLKSGKAKVHLIHQVDVINIITSFIEQPHLNGIYNCVSPSNTTRDIFYQEAAKVQGLIPPQFAIEKVEIADKTINGEKLQRCLNYSFVVDDLLIWLNDGINE